MIKRAKLFLYSLCLCSVVFSQDILLPGTSLSGSVGGDQRVRDRHLVTSPVQTQEFEVYQDWDFEGEELGEYTLSEILEDFNADRSGLVAGSFTSIVEDTINGEATKVLRIKQEANQLYTGIQMNVYLDQVHSEVYLSYNWKFGKNWNSTSGGKLHGLRGLPSWSGSSCPGSGDGFVAWNHFKRSGRIIAYHYDRTSEWCPWATESYNFNDIYFTNGTWYNITQRLVLNTFNGDFPNADGINEVWVDGRLVFQERGLILVQDRDKGIEALSIQNFYGGDYDHYKPLTDCYGYMDNIKVFIPTDDPTRGTRNVHDPGTVYETPDEIIDKRVYYDQLIKAEGPFQNRNYGGSYPGCTDETYLIDAGEGNTVIFQLDYFEIGKGDYIFVYDGNTSDANLLRLYKGYTYGGNEDIISSGRYMFVRLSSDRDGSASGWTGTLAGYTEEEPVIQPDIEAPSVPTGLRATGVSPNSTDLAWNASVDNRAVTGYRVYLDGSLDGSTSGTTYTLTQLQSETTYNVSVSSFDAASNNSQRSTPIVITTLEADLAAPTVPTGLEVLSVTGSTITMGWSASSDNVEVTGYRIFMDGSEVGTSVTTTFTVSGLSSNTSYLFSVSAFDGASNESSPSPPVSGSTGAPDTEPPTVPTGLKVINTTSNSISIIWNSSVDNVQVEGYRVFANGLLKGESATNSYTITELRPGITYNIAVSAFDAESNESELSDVLSVTTVNPDVTLDPTMPEVETVGIQKKAASVETVSRMKSLGHTVLQDYGVLFSDDPANIESGLIYYGEPGEDSVSHDRRLNTHLVAFYDFTEGRGNRVYDRSNQEPPLDLTINKQLNTYWLPGQGLEVTGNTMIYSQESPQRLIGALQETNEITVEAWIKQTTLKQSGPARILTLSADNSSRAFTIGHQGTITDFDYSVRLSTTATEGENGLPEIMTEQDFFTPGLHHFIYSRDAEGNEKVWVNAQLKYSGVRPGQFSAWSGGNRFALANELSEERPWNGVYYLVGIYNKAMNEPEVQQQYAAGFGDLHFTVDLESLQTNTPYYFSPFVRTDQGIVYGEVEEVMIRNVRDFAGSDSLEIAVVPNPSDGTFLLSFQDGSNESEEAMVRVVDMSGQVIYTEELDLGGNLQSYEKEFNLADLMRSGLYTVIVILGSKAKAERLVIYSN